MSEQVTPTRMSLTIAGMHCAGCVKSVTRVLSAVPGVTGATVDLAQGKAEVTGTAPRAALAEAVKAAGYGAI